MMLQNHKLKTLWLFRIITERKQAFLVQGSKLIVERINFFNTLSGFCVSAKTFFLIHRADKWFIMWQRFPITNILESFWIFINWIMEMIFMRKVFFDRDCLPYMPLLNTSGLQQCRTRILWLQNKPNCRFCLGIQNDLTLTKNVAFHFDLSMA